MQIIEPSVELWEQNQDIEHVARCARVCYGKENTDTEKLCKFLIKKNHLSMFRHASYYAIVPPSAELPQVDLMHKMVKLYGNCPYIEIDLNENTGKWYIATNGNFIIDHANSVIEKLIRDYIVSPEEFANNSLISKNMMRYTFKIVTQISTAKELNRVSPNNIAEQSTRYVDLQNGAICRPHWLKEEPELGDTYEERLRERVYIETCEEAFESYKTLVNLGLKREDARGVLPYDTASIVVYTYSMREWRHIFNNRLYDITGRAHENCKIVMRLIKNELQKKGHIV